MKVIKIFILFLLGMFNYCFASSPTTMLETLSKPELVEYLLESNSNISVEDIELFFDSKIDNIKKSDIIDLFQASSNGIGEWPGNISR